MDRPPWTIRGRPVEVAWSPTLGYAEVDDEVLSVCERALEVMASLGTEIVEVDRVFDDDPVNSWITLSGAYNLRTHAELRDTAMGQVDPVLAMVIDGAAADQRLGPHPGRRRVPSAQSPSGRPVP